MKNTLMVIFLAFLFCLIVGCQQGGEVAEEPVADVEADIQAIKDIVADITAAVNAADIDTLVSFYADDAVRIPSNEPAAVGKEAIQKGVQQMFDEISAQEKDVVEDVRVSGDLAVAHITWSNVVMPKGGDDSFTAIVNVDKSGEAKIESIEAEGERRRLNGNWILVFKRQSDNTWKIIYSIWSDESLVSPTQAE